MYINIYKEENVVYAVINGGFFDMTQNTSASFLAENGKVKSKNTFNTATNLNPTVGAFGQAFTGKFQTEYIYSYGTNLETYKFQVPNPYPGPPPEKASGRPWIIREGIGAGPILLKSTFIIKGNL